LGSSSSIIQELGLRKVCRGGEFILGRLRLALSLVVFAFGLAVMALSGFVMAQMPNVSFDAALTRAVLRQTPKRGGDMLAEKGVNLGEEEREKEIGRRTESQVICCAPQQTLSLAHHVLCNEDSNRIEMRFDSAKQVRS
jgi:hypothetical protein